MLVRPLLAACLLGGLFPLLSQAQTIPVTSRFYGGVGVTLYSNVPFQTNGIVPRLLGPSLLAGWQLTPRLAGQVGLSYHWTTDTYASSASSTPFTLTERSHYLLVPVLLRYTLTTTEEKIRFELLGGATLLHARLRRTFDSAGPLAPALYASRSSDTRLNLTFGPAVRAALSPRLALAVNSLVNMRLGETYYRFSDRLFLSTSLGVSYSFGAR